MPRPGILRRAYSRGNFSLLDVLLFISKEQ
jgi:hypothetical protein